MKTQKINNKYIIIALLICLVASQLLGFSSFAFATEGNSFDKQTVYEDLSADNNFSIFDYPADNSRQLEIIKFVEYGYCYDDNKQSNYALYIYIYNPHLIDFNQTQASVQIKGNSGNYNKYELILLSKSKNENTLFKENLFYKFKIKNASEILSNLEHNKRSYTISGIEFNAKNDNIIQDYPIQTTYTLTGYAKGYDSDINKESTLQQYKNQCTVVNLNIKDTYFRTDTSALGKYHQNTLNSVYFAIPNYIIENYGELQVITATWNEQKTAPILVTSNKENYNLLSNYLGINAENTPYSFCANPTSDTSGSTIVHMNEFGFNLAKHSTSLNEIRVTNNIDRLTNLFYTGGINANGYIIESKSLLNYLRNYNKSYVNGTLANGISKDVLSNSVDTGRTQGTQTATIDTRTDKFNMLSYLSNKTWWQAIKDYGFNTPSDLGTSYNNIDPIKKISKAELNSSTIINDLYINDNDRLEFISYCNDAITSQSTPYLFRFAVTDYYSAPVYNWKNNCNFVAGDYLAQETVFFDFDIISLNFYKEGNESIIGTVANPIDIATDVTSPPHAPSWWERILEFFKKYWKYFAIALGVVVALYTIPIWLPLLFKLVIWLVTLPFIIIKKSYSLVKARALAREQASNINAVQALKELERQEQAMDTKVAKKQKRNTRKKKT